MTFRLRQMRHWKVINASACGFIVKSRDHGHVLLCCGTFEIFKGDEEFGRISKFRYAHSAIHIVAVAFVEKST